MIAGKERGGIFVRTTIGFLKNENQYCIRTFLSDNKVVFLRTLKPGGSEHSFGLYVAKLAGMPQTVIQKAEQLLKTLEKSGAREGHREKMSDSASGLQLSFIQLEDPVLLEIKEELADLDIDHLTPVEALMKLQEIKNKLGKL